MNHTLDPPIRAAAIPRSSAAANESVSSPASSSPVSSVSSSSAAQRLRSEFAAVRLSFTWLGVRKSLSPDQKRQVAEGFGATGQFLSAGKKLLDTRHARYRALTNIRGRVQSYWKALSLPYPEPGLRLIRQENITPFGLQMQQFQQELGQAAAELEEAYDQLRDSAKARLGSLYDPADYPASLRGLFDMSWEFPSVEPPPYLLRLDPKLYQQEQARLAARFDEAARLAEEAFTTEFAQLVAHLVERLTPGVSGEAKVFRDSAVENLCQFFQRFKSLSVGSGGELEELVEQAQRVLQGAGPEAVRQSSSLRQRVASQLSRVQSQLDQLLVEAPRRRILRSVSPSSAATATPAAAAAAPQGGS